MGRRPEVAAGIKQNCRGSAPTCRCRCGHFTGSLGGLRADRTWDVGSELFGLVRPEYPRNKKRRQRRRPLGSQPAKLAKREVGGPDPNGMIGAGHGVLCVGQHALFTGKFAHFLLQLLESAHFDLADALAADVVLAGQFFKRNDLILQTALHQDVFLAVVQH